MLNRLAELFEVSVSDLLGSKVSQSATVADINEVANQLSILNEQLVMQARNRKRTLKIILISIASIIFISFVIYSVALLLLMPSHTSEALTSVELNCTLNGEEYKYVVTYDE